MQNNEYNFQPMRYYLSQSEKKNKITIGKLYFPKDIQEANYTVSKEFKDFYFNVWLFDFSNEEINNLISFSARFNCKRKFLYPKKDTHFLKCEI